MLFSDLYLARILNFILLVNLLSLKRILKWKFGSKQILISSVLHSGFFFQVINFTSSWILWSFSLNLLFAYFMFTTLDYKNDPTIEKSNSRTVVSNWLQSIGINIRSKTLPNVKNLYINCSESTIWLLIGDFLELFFPESFWYVDGTLI